MSLIASLIEKKKKQSELKQHLKEFAYHIVFTIGKDKWYCYDSPENISQGRSAQLNAIVNQSRLNIDQDDLKALSKLVIDMTEMAEAQTINIRSEAAKLLSEKNAPPQEVLALLNRVAKMETTPLKVIKQLHEEISKRMELLTHPEYLYRLAAVMYWTDGEDPRIALDPSQILKKAEYFKKKADQILLRLLSSPVSSILYNLDISKPSSVAILQMELTKQQPFREFSDMILTRAGLQSLVSGTTQTTK